MGNLFYNIVIAPIELVVEVVFEFLFRIIGMKETNQGFVLVGVSLVISLLTLPLYRQADIIQKKAREKQKQMSPWLTHIKKAFHGDERFMMTQAYYKINNYNPLSILESAVPLLLQIPFFTAAYHFLSHLEALRGASFGLIVDLGKPDGLIKIGALTLNLLPIMMTTINCVSGAVYLKGFALKDKLQTYGMAIVFLFLLYNSPSGLVVYWTCNNIFSLVKNIFYKLKNPRKTIDLLSALFGISFMIILFNGGTLTSRKKCIAVLLITLCTFIPLILSLLKKYDIKNYVISNFSIEKKEIKQVSLIFILSGLLLSILTGLLIPLSLISSSPADFFNVQNNQSPFVYLFNSFSYAVGFFVLWAGIVYAMISEKGKLIFTKLFCVFSICSLITFMFFGKKLGTISSVLVYDVDPSFSGMEKVFNLLILFIVFILCFILSKVKHIKKITIYAYIVLIICVSGVCIYNVNLAGNRLNKVSYLIDNEKKYESNELKPIFNLSKSGKNVIVFMLDRSISGYLQMAFEEKPILKKQFSGFTYYPNTISFGMHTMYGAPAIFGGYEYTPTEMNKRNTELLVDKHNEALKLMPIIFSENNFNISVYDLPDANYQSFPDLSIFYDIKNCHTYNDNGICYDNLKEKYKIEDENRLESNKRNFFCYSIFKILPVCLQTFWYDRGTYYSTANYNYIGGYLRNYAFLEFLPDLTQIFNDSSNNASLICNETTHNPVKLNLPDYNFINTPESDDIEPLYKFPNIEIRNHYHVMISSLMALGKWFDYMRVNGVYDNTRIIIVSDHGRTNNVGTNGLHYWDYMEIKNPKMDVTTCNPLMLFKDFNATEFSVSNEFMTNADVPTFALNGLVDKPINPFTGKEINTSEKYAHPQLITSSHKYAVQDFLDKTTFANDDESHWYSVHDDIFNEENWELVK